MGNKRFCAFWISAILLLALASCETAKPTAGISETSRSSAFDAASDAISQTESSAEPSSDPIVSALSAASSEDLESCSEEGPEAKKERLIDDKQARDDEVYALP